MASSFLIRKGIWDGFLVVTIQLLVLGPQVIHGKALFGITQDYQAATLLVFHDAATAPSSITSATYKIVATRDDGTETEISAVAPLPSASIDCDADTVAEMFRLCTFTIADLMSIQMVDYYKDTITVYISDPSDPAEIAIPYVGRNFKPADAGGTNVSPLITASSGLEEAGVDFTLGSADNAALLDKMGSDNVAQTVKLYYDSNQEALGVRITVEYSSDLTATIGDQTGVQVGILVGEVDGTSVESVQVRYNAENQFCGITMTSSANSLSAGCIASEDTTNVLYTISTGWGFSGFYQISGEVSNTAVRLLLPLQYQLLPPQLAYYDLPDDRNLVAVWKDFWGAQSGTVSLNIQDSRDEQGALKISDYTLDVTKADDGSYFMFNIQDITELPSGSLACTPFTLQFNIAADSIRVYADPTPLNSWTQRYTTVGSAATAESSEQSDLGTTVYSSARNRYTGGFSDCLTSPQMFGSQEVALVNGILYNGEDLAPLGPVVPGVNPPTSSLSNNFNKVDVYFDENTGNLVAINFLNDATSVVSLGNAGGNTAQTISAPVEGAILHRVEAILNTDGTQTRKLTFIWIVPSAPWNIFYKPVMKKAGSIANPFNTVGERSDLLEVKFWAPNSAKRFGLKLTKQSTGTETEVTFGTSQTFTRGTDFTRGVYNLDAESSYDFVIYGFDTNTGLASTESEMFSFTTSTGVQVQCDVDGEMYTLIDYEAVPHSGIQYTDAPTVSFGTAPAPSITVSAEHIQDPYSDESNYFQYSFNVATNFYGYPTTLALYWETGGTFFTGLSISYANGEGGEITEFLAGEQTNNVVTAGLVPDQFHLAGFDYTADSEGRLTGLKLINENDVALGGGCFDINDASTCETTGSRQSDLGNQNAGNYRVYSIKVTIAQDYAANPGIYGLQFQYVNIDLPALMTATPAACNADATIDLEYFHNTYWLNSLNTANVDTCSLVPSVYPSASGSPISIPAVEYIRTFQKEGETGSGDPVTGSGVDIVRQSGWSVSSICYYEANATLDSSFDTQGEEAEKASSLNDLDFQMQIAKSSDYSTFYGTDELPSVLLNEVLYVQVSLANDLDGFSTVVATECYATKTNDPGATDRYVIENPTCDADSSFERPVDPTTVDRFHFTTFAWFVDQVAQNSVVYFHCVVRACPTSSADQCDLPAGCVGPRTSSRRRREVSYQPAKGPGGPLGKFESLTRREVSYQPAKGPGGPLGKFESETMRHKRGVQMRERVISQPLLIRQTRQADSEMLHIERDVMKPVYQQPLVLLTAAFSLFALISFVAVSFKARSWFARSARYDLLTNDSFSQTA